MAVPLVPGPGLGDANAAQKSMSTLLKNQCDFCAVLIEPKHLPARPGEPARRDHGYVRNGVADVFVAFAPLLCERHARAAPTRAGGTWPRPCDGSRATRARRQGAWSWSGTTRARALWDPPARRSRRRRPGARPPASRPITRLGTGAGRAWRRSRSAASCATAFRRASGASTRWSASRPPERRTATHAPGRPAGSSRSVMPGIGSPGCILK